MSWSARTTEPVAPIELEFALGDAAKDVQAPEGHEQAFEDQIRAAIDAAAVIANSGAVGDRPVTASINGHGNPGHEPCGSWVNDTVTVTVSQAPVPKETA